MTAVDMTKLPYAYDANGRSQHAIMFDLHVLLCDIALKNPKVEFHANGASLRSDGTREVSDVLVFNNQQRVGRLWLSEEYISGERLNMYLIDSPRIHQQRGSRNRKKTKHYKIALKTALDSFKEYPTNEVAGKVMEDASYHLNSVASNAAYAMKESVSGVNGLGAVLNYLADVLDNGPQPVPPTLLTLLDSRWRDKLTTSKIVADIHREFLKGNGLLVKLATSGVMTVVDLTTKDVLMVTDNSYDLPVEYQEKLAILKIMEGNQAVHGIGIKVLDDKIPLIYMTSGKIETTC